MQTYHNLQTPIPLGYDGPLSVRDVKRWLQHGPTAWPGGDPLFFITSDGAALAFSTVRAEWPLICSAIRDNRPDGWQVVAVAVNYEDGALFDAHTEQRIECAYGAD